MEIKQKIQSGEGVLKQLLAKKLMDPARTVETQDAIGDSRDKMRKLMAAANATNE
jgi:hypothetical protein